MKKIDVVVLTVATVLAVVLSASVSAQAQGAADLFKSKCAMCHGADGTGSAIGKKMGAHDFTTAEVQKMSDANITETITNGKNKMPKYSDKLKPEEIKGLVAYIRSLKK
jgi:mono/diheme cytochrome c family protein